MSLLLPQIPTTVALSTADLAQLPEVVERLKRIGDEDLAKLDIAALNLMCAGGLPGAEGLEFARYFDLLDNAAREADLTTRRHWYRFNASPQTYNQSPG